MIIAGPLGRLAPRTWEHYEKYPLTAATMPDAAATVVIGVNWYSAFDSPVQDKQGHWWIGRSGSLGSVRGGHCVCLKPKSVSDLATWWDYYNQGQEGRCVQFGVSRMQTLRNRKQYEVREDRPDNAGRWLYFEAQRNDEWEGGAYPGATEFYEGTSVNAALNVARTQGLIPKGKFAPVASEGVSTFRWAKTADDALSVLRYGGLDYVDILNSWGRSYPHLVRMPASVLQKLIDEDGEVGLVTDR